MSVIIDVFSGRPNPVLVVSEPLAQQVRELVLTRRRAAVAGWPSLALPLGFRGLVVEDSDDASTMRLGIPGMSDAAEFDHVEELLRSLTEMSWPSELDRTTYDVIIEAVNAARQWRGPLRDTPAADAPTTPQQDVQFEAECPYSRLDFNPSAWNQFGIVQTNNCYNYGTNFRTNTFAQPGAGSGRRWSSIACDAIGQAAVNDGARWLRDCVPPSGQPALAMACVIWPGADYHWYRLHPRFWAHKPGQTPVRDTDDSGATILNVETCNRGPYTQFCGYVWAAANMRVA